MSSSRKKHAAAGGSSTATVSRLGGRSSFQGEVLGGGELVVWGSFDGAVRIRGRLVVAEEGSLRREVAARDMEVAGRFEGWFELSGRLRARTGARLAGNGVAARWIVEEGAHLELEMRSTPTS